MTKAGTTFGFAAGIAISAFTNLATGLDKQHFRLLHLISMGMFFFSGLLFYLATVGVTSAEDHARKLSDEPRRYLAEYSVNRFASLAVITGLAAVFLLVWDIFA